MTPPEINEEQHDQTNNPSGIPDGHDSDNPEIPGGDAGTGEGDDLPGGESAEGNGELPNSDTGNELPEDDGGTGEGSDGEEDGGDVPPVVVEDPPTTPVEPAPTPKPDPDPEPAPDPESPTKSPEELLAEIAEDERRLGIIDRNVAGQRLELARKKNQLAAMFCPIKPGDIVRLDRSRFKLVNVLAIIAPSGAQHKNGIKSFSMTAQGVKQDGSLSDVIWTAHDYA